MTAQPADDWQQNTDVALMQSQRLGRSEQPIEVGRSSVLPNFGRIIRPNNSVLFGSATLCYSAELRRTIRWRPTAAYGA